MVFRLLLLASLLLSVPAVAEDYEIDETEGEAVDVCIPEEECDDGEISYRSRKRYRNRRRCCWRDLDAHWPGKMDNSFMERMRR